MRKALCPRCHHPGFKVVHVQAGRHGDVVYRKRECSNCHYWLSTQERLIPTAASGSSTDGRILALYHGSTKAGRLAVVAMLKALNGEGKRV